MMIGMVLLLDFVFERVWCDSVEFFYLLVNYVLMVFIVFDCMGVSFEWLDEWYIIYRWMNKLVVVLFQVGCIDFVYWDGVFGDWMWEIDYCYFFIGEVECLGIDVVIC